MDRLQRHTRRRCARQPEAREHKRQFGWAMWLVSMWPQLKNRSKAKGAAVKRILHSSCSNKRLPPRIYSQAVEHTTAYERVLTSNSTLW